ncbi:hypothetical protein L208DRAFT_1405595, partial [Tricholoma matsutake]
RRRTHHFKPGPQKLPYIFCQSQSPSGLPHSVFQPRDHLFIHDPMYSSSLSVDTVVACHPHHKGSGGSG